MSRKVLTIFGLSLLLVWATMMTVEIKEFSITFAEKERIEVSIREVGDEKIIAFLLVRATSSDVEMDEIIARADSEAEKLGGKAEIFNFGVSVRTTKTHSNIPIAYFNVPMERREEFLFGRFAVYRNDI